MTSRPASRVLPCVLGLLAALGTLSSASPLLAAPQGPYLTVRDDGTVENPDLQSLAGVRTLITRIIDLYKAGGGQVPETLSVWTTFPFGGEAVSTLFIPLVEDIGGLNLEDTFTLDVAEPPLRNVLLHNDITQLDYRAEVQKAPLEGLGTYLFMLEFSHNWGPQVQIPEPNPGALIGFDFHWSFWMDAGGSPAGGNIWVDNGDGTFTTSGQLPSTVRFSMVDLYIMGLADASEVPPFGVLENPVPPAGVTDPFTGRALSGASFPWFRPESLTVEATRRVVTVEDLVTANGARTPAHADAPQSFKVGIVLVVGQNATDEQVAAAEATLDPIARAYAPTFAEATSQRGALEIVSMPPLPDGGPDAGPDGGAVDAVTDTGPLPDTLPGLDTTPPTDTGVTIDLGAGPPPAGGCRVAASAGEAAGADGGWLLLALLGLLAMKSLSRRATMR